MTTPIIAHKLYITGIHHSIDETEISQRFENFGRVKDVTGRGLDANGEERVRRVLIGLLITSARLSKNICIFNTRDYCSWNG